MTPTAEPEEQSNPFGDDILEWDLFQSQERTLREAIAQERETVIEPLHYGVRQTLMLVYLEEFEEHLLIERLNKEGLPGRQVWRNAHVAWKRLHGKGEDD